MRIRVADEAEQDLVDGSRFYESQSPGLGEYFLDSLFADIESLRLYAGIHSKHFGYFRLLSKRFPFAIYYRQEEDVIEIRAILDCRQDPVKTDDRFEDPAAT